MGTRISARAEVFSRAGGKKFVSCGVLSSRGSSTTLGRHGNHPIGSLDGDPGPGSRRCRAVGPGEPLGPTVSAAAPSASCSTRPHKNATP